MIKRFLISVVLLLSVSAHAAYTVSGVFDMYDPSGALISSDDTIWGEFDLDAGTWQVFTIQWFYGYDWYTDPGTLYTEGTYTVDVNGDGSSGPDSGITFTVGAGQLAGHIDFNWGSITGIDVINVWDVGADGSLTYAYVPGMIDGPFPGFQASFSFEAPVAVFPCLRLSGCSDLVCLV